MSEKTDKIDRTDIRNYNGTSFYLLSLALVLMPLNWLIETYKWKQLTQKVQRLGMKEAVESILIGILSSIISPNRIGELGGRLLHIKKENLLSVFYSNMLCSVSQLVVTLVAGLLAILLNINLAAQQMNISELLLLIGSSISIILVISLYFSSNMTYRLIKYTSSKFKSEEHIVGSRIGVTVRIRLIVMSSLRYIVFSLQFLFLLLFFGLEESLLASFGAISIVFFITAIIPTAWISDLPVRTSVAYFIFELFFQSGLPALYSSISLWGINLLLPALISLVFLPKVNWMAIKKISL